MPSRSENLTEAVGGVGEEKGLFGPFFSIDKGPSPTQLCKETAGTVSLELVLQKIFFFRLYKKSERGVFTLCSWSAIAREFCPLQDFKI